jgi:hypothetical protein
MRLFGLGAICIASFTGGWCSHGLELTDMLVQATGLSDLVGIMTLLPLGVKRKPERRRSEHSHYHTRNSN